MRTLRVVADAAMAALALALAYWLRFHFLPGGIVESADPGKYRAFSVVMAVTVVSVFALTGVYRNRRGVAFIDELFSVLRGMAGSFVVGLAIIGLYKAGPFTYSRLTFFLWTAIATLLIALARFAIRSYQRQLQARGVGAERALVVGWGAAADLLVQRMRMFPDYGYELVGILADNLEQGGQVYGSVDVLGRVSDLARTVRGLNVKVVFLALSDVSQDRVLHLMDTCRDCDVDFRIVPGMLEILTSNITSDELGGVPLLQVRHGLDIDGWAVFLKRAFDVAVAGLGLLLISPLLGIIALVVKTTSPGPVLIHQDRLGMRGKVFRMHKFRSMRVDAEAASGPVWAAERDPRRTGAGRVLRRLSLDELPQLWNILQGQMSLVGPRAERPKFVKEFSARLPRYDDRHRVRPGLAGWAQANDLRGQTPVEERLIYDLYYIENWSLAFDLKILLITLARVWTHKNAY